jgi:hypothetical protein
VRYPKYRGWAGFISMALFRIPLFFNKKISFWKLLGCGKNGTFDIHPDWHQWGLLTVNDGSPIVNQELPVSEFIDWWWNIFHCEKFSIVLQPIEGHGKWDGKEVFGSLARETLHEGLVAVLTRATIRLNKLKSFWRNVDSAATQMNGADGFITSFGIGEVPWIKQATFSVWTSKGAMKKFAYKMKEHAEVIRKTRKENWYSEEMFVRFIPLASFGSINGKNPLEGIL